MGCYLSKLPRDSHSRIFRVSNVDDLGAEISPGKIEVTDSDLIWYQRGKEPIRWPLRCLRRYGFDEELFSFESGRRCPTGSGIYAFKCLRAEELFNLVQEAIQTVGQHSHLRASQTHVNGGAPVSVTVRQSSRPTSVIDPRDMHEPSGIRLSDAGRVAVVPNDQHLYMNGALPSTQRAEAQANYINTGPDNMDVRGRNTDDHAAALIDFLHNPPMAPPPPKQETVNYADLDLPRSTENLFDACDGAEVLDYQGTGSVVTGLQDPENEEGLQGRIDVEDIGLNYADLDVFTDNPTDQPTYINVDAEGKIKESATNVESAESVKVSRSSNMNGSVKRNLLIRSSSVEQNYTNIGASSFNYCPEPTPQVSAPVQQSNGSTNRSSVSGELNYIEIDVNKTESDSANGAAASAVTSVSYSVPDSPSKRTESYALIDFNRTVALSNSSKVVSDDGEGLRKTRHNSTIT